MLPFGLEMDRFPPFVSVTAGSAMLAELKLKVRLRKLLNELRLLFKVLVLDALEMFTSRMLDRVPPKPIVP